MTRPAFDPAKTYRFKADAFPFEAAAKVPAMLDWDADVSNPPTIGTSTFDPATDEVTTDVASRNASKADVSLLATEAKQDAAKAVIDEIKVEILKLPGEGRQVTGLNVTPGSEFLGQTEIVRYTLVEDAP